MSVSEKDTLTISRRAQLRDLRSAWERLCLGLVLCSLPLAVYLVLRILDPEANPEASRAVTILSLGLWFLLVLLPLPLFQNACRRRIALNLLHEGLLRDISWQLSPVLPLTPPSFFMTRYERSERLRLFILSYLRPLDQLRASYSAACKARAREPFPLEYYFALIFPLLHLLVFLLGSLLYADWKSPGEGLEFFVFIGCYPAALLYCEYQLAFQGLLLERLLQSEGIES